MVTSEGQGSYITPRVRKDEESPLYSCSAHTIEPSQLAAVCTALSGGNRRGVHVIWAEYEEFMYVDFFFFSFSGRGHDDNAWYADQKRQRPRFWMQLSTG